MKLLTYSLLASFIATANASVSAQEVLTAPLQITVNNIRSGEGAVVIAAFDQADAFENMDVSKAIALSYIPASSASVSITLHSLSQASYAVAALHDANMDGDLNMDGDVPTEGYSFVAMGPSGLPPKFEDAAVATKAGATATLRLKYWQ